VKELKQIHKDAIVIFVVVLFSGCAMGQNYTPRITGVEVFDVDGDGTKEIITAGFFGDGCDGVECNATIGVFNYALEQLSNYTFKEEGVAHFISDLIINDLDGDGIHEIISTSMDPYDTSTFGAGVRAWNYTSSDKLTLIASYSYAAPGMDAYLTAANFTGDANNETIFVPTASDLSEYTVGVFFALSLDRDNQQFTLLNNPSNCMIDYGYAGDSGFRTTIIKDVDSANLDSDDDIEIVVAGAIGTGKDSNANYTAYVGIWNYTGGDDFVEQANISFRLYDEWVFNIVSSVDLKDMAGDATPEIVVAGYAYPEPFAETDNMGNRTSFVKIFSYNGDDEISEIVGYELTDPDFSNTTKITKIKVFDFNSDGKKEIVAAGYVSNETESCNELVLCLAYPQLTFQLPKIWVLEHNETGGIELRDTYIYENDPANRSAFYSLYVDTDENIYFGGTHGNQNYPFNNSGYKSYLLLGVANMTLLSLDRANNTAGCAGYDFSCGGPTNPIPEFLFGVIMPLLVLFTILAVQKNKAY